MASRQNPGTRMGFDIEIQTACEKTELPLSGEEMSSSIETWAKAVLTAPQSRWLRQQPWQAQETVHHAAQLTVRLVDAEESAALNQNYRHRQGATNVLSFPFTEPFQLQPPLLGDIVICVPLVAAEAREQNKTLLAHWAHLVVHGTLHLLGYDHLGDNQAEEMESLEIMILAQLGFADPYHEPINQQEHETG